MRTSAPAAVTAPSTGSSSMKIVTPAAARSHSRTLLVKRSTTGSSLLTCAAPATGVVLCSTTAAKEPFGVVKAPATLWPMHRLSSLHTTSAGIVTVYAVSASSRLSTALLNTVIVRPSTLSTARYSGDCPRGLSSITMPGRAATSWSNVNTSARS